LFKQELSNKKYIPIEEINLNFIFDEEFVNIVNSLSYNIKDFMKTCNYNIKYGINNSNTINDNLSTAKGFLEETINQINSFCQHSKNINCFSNKNNIKENPISNNHIAFINLEKNLKEKLNPLIEKIDLIAEIRKKLSKNLINIENNCGKFYDEAKLTFKNMKNLHSKKLNELEKYNNYFNFENSLENNVLNNTEYKDSNFKNDDISNYSIEICEKNFLKKQECEIKHQKNNTKECKRNFEEGFTDIYNNIKKSNLKNIKGNNIENIENDKNDNNNNKSFNNKSAIDNNTNKKKITYKLSNYKTFEMKQPIKRNIPINENNYLLSKINNTTPCNQNNIQNTNINSCQNKNNLNNNSSLVQNLNELNNYKSANIFKNEDFSNKQQQGCYFIKQIVKKNNIYARSKSNPRTFNNFKNGRLSALENNNLLNNQTYTNLNVLQTTTNNPSLNDIYNNLITKNKSYNIMNFNSTSNEHLINMRKFTQNRLNRNKNSQNRSLNNSNTNKNYYSCKNINTSIDNNDLINKQIKENSNSQNFFTNNHKTYELLLKNNNLNEELNKLHDSYNIIESENVKLKKLNDKISKNFLLDKSSSCNTKEKISSNLSNKIINKNNNHMSKSPKDSRDFISEKICLEKFEDLNNIYYKKLGINNLIDFSVKKSKSLENSKKNKNLNKISENFNDLNDLLINNQTCKESNLAINSNLNSKSHNSMKYDYLSNIVFSEKVISFIRILNDYLEEKNKKSFSNHINVIKLIIDKNKQELIQLANDSIFKSKIWINENLNKKLNNKNNLDISTSLIQSNISNTKIPSNKIYSNDLDLLKSGKNLGKNNSQNSALCNDDLKINEKIMNSSKKLFNTSNNFIKKSVDYNKENSNLKKSNSKSNLNTAKRINQTSNKKTLFNNIINTGNISSINPYINSTTNNVNNNNNNLFILYLTNLNKLNNNLNTCKNSTTKSVYSSFNINNNKKFFVNKKSNKIKKNNNTGNNNDLNINLQSLENNDDTPFEEKENQNLKSRLLENDLNNILNNENLIEDQNIRSKDLKDNKNIIRNIVDSDAESENLHKSTMNINSYNTRTLNETKINSEFLRQQISENKNLNKAKNIFNKNFVDNNSTHTQSLFNNLKNNANKKKAKLSINDLEDLNSYNENRIDNIENQNKIQNNSDINNFNNISQLILKNNYLNTNFKDNYINYFSTDNNKQTNYESNENHSEHNFFNTNGNYNVYCNSSSNNIIINDKIDEEEKESKIFKNNLHSYNKNNHLDLNGLNNDLAEKLKLKLLDSKKYLSEYFKLNIKNTNNDDKLEYECSNIPNKLINKSLKKSCNKGDVSHEKNLIKLKNFNDHEYMTAIRLNINLQEANEKLNKELEILKNQILNQKNEIQINNINLQSLNEDIITLKKRLKEIEVDSNNTHKKVIIDKYIDNKSDLILENKILKEENLIEHIKENNNKLNFFNKDLICYNCKYFESIKSNNTSLLEDFKKELIEINKKLEEKEKKIKIYQIEIEKLNYTSDQKEQIINNLNKKKIDLESNKNIINTDISNENFKSNEHKLNTKNSLIKTHDFINSNSNEIDNLIKRIEEYERLSDSQINTINELNIKLKVNKNEKDSLFSELEKAKNQINNKSNLIYNYSNNIIGKSIKTEECYLTSNMVKKETLDNLELIKNFQKENLDLKIKIVNINELKILVNNLEVENSKIKEKLSLKESEIYNYEELNTNLIKENSSFKNEKEKLTEQINKLKTSEDEKSQVYEEKLDHLQKKLNMISINNENLKNENFNIKSDLDIFKNENRKSTF